MNYSNTQIRSAILRAADRIEREDSYYNHCKASVGGGGCVLAHIGEQLGMADGTEATQVSRAIGIPMKGSIDYSTDLFRFLQANYGDRCKDDKTWGRDRNLAAAGLRAFADVRFPAPSKDEPVSDFIPCQPEFLEELKANLGVVA